MLNEPSTTISNAAITRGDQLCASHMHFFNSNTGRQHTLETVHFFNFGRFFFKTDTWPPHTGLKFRLPV